MNGQIPQKEELTKMNALIDLLNLEDMEGDFNMCMDMQRKAHDGNRDETTRKFWLGQTRHKRNLIDAYKALMEQRKLHERRTLQLKRRK